MTKRQTEVLRFIANFIERESWSPSFEEIAAGMELRSISTVAKHLDRIEGAGLIKRRNGVMRSIEITPKGQRALRPAAALVKATGKFLLLVVTDRGRVERAGEISELPAAWDEAAKIL